MADIPPRPSFPKSCWMSILILISVIIVSLIVNKLTEKKDPKKTKSNGYIILAIVLSSFLLIIISTGCGWWYNYKKREWIYTYGNNEERVTQMASDVFNAVKH